MSDDDWMDDELIGILTKKRPKRRWWAVAARPVVPGTPSLPPGALDSFPALFVGFSFRKLLTVYAGKAMQVKRASDNVTQDVGFDASGNFDVAGFNTFIGVSSGTISIWYDQSGGGNNLIPSGTGPAVNLTGINGLPTAVFTAGGNALSVANPGTFSEPFSFSTVAERTGAFTSTGGLWGAQGDSSGIYAAASVSRVVPYSGGFATQANCTDSVAHSLICVFNGASSVLAVDNANTAQSLTGATLKGAMLGGLQGFNYVGNVSECLTWQSLLNAATISSLAANQKAYWGTP